MAKVINCQVKHQRCGQSHQPGQSERQIAQLFEGSLCERPHASRLLAVRDGQAVQASPRKIPGGISCSRTQSGPHFLVRSHTKKPRELPRQIGKVGERPSVPTTSGAQFRSALTPLRLIRDGLTPCRGLRTEPWRFEASEGAGSRASPTCLSRRRK